VSVKYVLLECVDMSTICSTLFL